jgi:glycosyltransferase involved in cell wall biosynthesis
MPTLGRNRVVQRAITCFLHQTYPNRELVILNQNPVPMTFNLPQVRVINVCHPYESVYAVYEVAMTYADGELLNFWDDDDVRFPWFLEEVISNKTKKAAKTREFWTVYGGRFLRTENIIEPAVVVDLNHVKEYGFDKLPTIIHMSWHQPLIDSNELELIPAYLPGFVYVFGEPGSQWHISGDRNQQHSFDTYIRQNRDYGDGKYVPVDMKAWYERWTQENPELRARLGLERVRRAHA